MLGFIVFIKTQEKISAENEGAIHDQIGREHEDQKKNSKKQEEIEKLEPEDPVRRSDFPKPLHGIFHR
jgi:hypothetical protein